MFMQLLKAKVQSPLLVIIAFIAILAGSCTTDKDIKAQLTGMAKSDVNFAGVAYSVEGKTVTLTGKCPSQKAKDAVEQAVKNIKVVNGIKNQIQISPVILDLGFAMKLAVDSVLATYPTVIADVAPNNVVLKGNIKKAELVPLLTSVKKLNLPNVENQLITN
jgi:hyperosmotically inducible protein